MRNGEYGLGIDVGDGAVTAAVCAVDGGAGALPIGEGPVTAAVGDDGRVGLVPAGGTARSRPLVARVGDPVPVYTGGRAAPAAELVAAVVQRVREQAAERAGRPDAWTVVTVPPSWAGHRCAVLARALTAAGVPRFSLVSSAVAAVSAHVAAGDLPAGPTVAVYDLGAGTLDTAVVGPTADQPLAHLAVPPAPLPWGGRDVDDAVVTHVLDCLGTASGDPAALRAACVAAKEALSTATVVRVDLDGAAGGSVRVTREELDEVLAGPARRSAGVLAATVAAAGLRPADLDAVVLVGGGVRVPLVAEVLSGELGRPLVVGDDPALTAALGAASLAAEAIALDTAAERTVAVDTVAVDTATLDTATLDTAAPDTAAGEPSPVLPPARGPRVRRDRTRSAPAAGTSSRPPRPALRRDGRLRRGAVVGGLSLGLLLLGPAAAGLFDAVLAPPPVGQDAAAAADDGDGGVSGSAAVGGSSPAARGGGSAGGAAARTAARSAGSPARTSLAAAIATAAGTGAPPGSGRAAAATSEDTPQAPPAAPSPSRGAADDAGTPAGSAATPQTPDSSESGTSAGLPPPAGRPSAGGEPTAEPTPAQPTPLDPKPMRPAPVQPTPVDPTPPEPTPPGPEPTDPEPTPSKPVDPEPTGTPVDPTPEEPTPPAVEQPAPVQTPAEPAGDPGPAATTGSV